MKMQELKDSNIKYLVNKAGEKIYYEKIAHNNESPYIVFMHGFRSDMEGTKALALREYAIAHKLNYIRFEYRGHGVTEADFVNYKLSDWLEDCLLIVDELVPREAILVGSSMGGWLALLTSLARPGRVKSIIGLAAAPDFTEDLLWKKLSADEQKKLVQENRLTLTSDFCESEYEITYNFIQDAEQYFLLSQEIKITHPVTLIHGIQDKDVPYHYAMQIADKLQSQEVKIILLKEADHRLSQARDIELLKQEISTSGVIIQE